MLIGRRSFIMSTTLLATAPALANLLSLSSIARSHSSLMPELVTSQAPAGAADMNGLVFKIDGWNVCDDIASVSAPIDAPDSHHQEPAGEHVLISINRSWQCGWR